MILYLDVPWKLHVIIGRAWGGGWVMGVVQLAGLMFESRVWVKAECQWTCPVEQFVSLLSSSLLLLPIYHLTSSSPQPRPFHHASCLGTRKPWEKPLQTVIQSESLNCGCWVLGVSSVTRKVTKTLSCSYHWLHMLLLPGLLMLWFGKCMSGEDSFVK